MAVPRIEQKIAISLSIAIVNAFCRKEPSPLAQHMDERTIFIGPRKRQILIGGAAVTNAWLPDHPRANFSVLNLSVSSVLTGPTSCEVILHYDVTWHKPDGSSLEHPQTMQVSWFLQPGHTSHTAQADPSREIPYQNYKVAVVNVSNPQDLDERDLVYNTFGDIGTATIVPSRTSSTSSMTIPASARDGQQPSGRHSAWIMISGVGATLSRYPSDSIIWIESAAKGKKSIVHTRGQEIPCVNRVRYFMDTYPGIFIQPSVSYIVNPLYVKNISRFQAELWNGQVLRIPEKKYTDFKKDFAAFFAQ